MINFKPYRHVNFNRTKLVQNARMPKIQILGDFQTPCTVYKNNRKRGWSSTFLTDVKLLGFVNFEARYPIFGFWPTLTIGSNVGFAKSVLIVSKSSKNFCPSLPGKKSPKKLQASLGKIFLINMGPLWEPYVDSHSMWGSHPKNRVPSLKIENPSNLTSVRKDDDLPLSIF